MPKKTQTKTPAQRAMQSVKEVHPARAHFGVQLPTFNPHAPTRRTGYGNIAGTYDTGNPIVVETNFFDHATKSTHFDLRVELKSLRPRIGLKTLKGQKADLLEQLKTLRTRLNAMIAMGERELTGDRLRTALHPKPRRSRREAQGTRGEGESTTRREEGREARTARCMMVE